MEGDSVATSAVETLRDVAPIVAVLLVFQVFVLRRRIANLRRVIVGFTYVVVGLALFIIGLDQALFPIGRSMAEQLTDPVGLGLEGHRDMLLFVVEEHLGRSILEALAEAGRFDEEVGTGIAFQIDVEDVVGLSSQLETIQHEIEDQI